MLLTPSETAQARGIAALVGCNPFQPRRVTLERQVLGDDFVPTPSVWNLRTSLDGDRPNVARISALAESLIAAVESRLCAGCIPEPEDRGLIEALALHHLYYRFRDRFFSLIQNGGQPSFYGDFSAQVERLSVRGEGPLIADPAHVFACFFQLARAFVNIYTHLIGGSEAMARLRANVWQSVFSDDINLYRRGLYSRMPDIPTLVLGPTGTGKELVARAIGASGYVPFDAKTCLFQGDFRAAFHAVNLSALSPTLIESELFGHRRGAFTGAVDNRLGFFETCPRHGCIFLDEIGELDGTLQVKLLRVLQERTLQRIGETTTRTFVGKVVAATNRAVAVEMAAGRFRADLYFRLCADIIHTPTLSQQLAQSPADVEILVQFAADRVSTPALSRTLAERSLRWIRGSLGANYPWPGNFRELEQCVRSVMVRGVYEPERVHRDEHEPLLQATDNAQLTSAELSKRYSALVLSRCGSRAEAARILDVDPRTLKSALDGATAGDRARASVSRR